MQALAGEKRTKMLGESDRERKLYDTSTTALTGKTESKEEKAFQGSLKRQDESLRSSLKTIKHTLLRVFTRV